LQETVMPNVTGSRLGIDAAAEGERIVAWLAQRMRELHRRGAVVGISGGLDSSVCFALCVRAFGPRQVTAVILPERESDPASEQLARELAATFKITPVVEDLTQALEGLGCYARRDDAIARVFPQYDPGAGHRAKISLPSDLLALGTLNIYTLTVVMPDGEVMSARLPPAEFAQIVAATNLKQRARAAALYHHAELQHFAVVGSINRNEQDLGFFVKHADSGVDLKPLAHLYKTQIRQLALQLGVPQAILDRVPTSDTYSAPVSQEEFFFRLPFETLDLLLAAWQGESDRHGAINALDHHSPQEVRNAWDDFDRKQRSTRYLRTEPLDMCASGPPIAARE
jgi:NAD+ synthase